jgi:uncharacterized membrane protein
MYRIIGADQKEYGPVSAEQLRQWIAEGRAGAQSLLRAEGAAEWKPLGEFPEFADALGGPAASPSAPASGAGAHIGLAQDTLSRDYDLDIGRCVSSAWELLKGNFGMIFGGVAIYLLVQGGMSMLGQIPFIGILLSLASLIITGPLTAGVYLFLLRHIRHQNADIGDIFLGFRVNFGQLVLGYIVISLLTGLAALPGVSLMAYPFYQFVHHEPVTAGLVLMLGAGFVLALVSAIYLNISWLFALPLIIDRQMEFWPAMGASRTLVGKHWWAVFGLVVVCGLINVVGVVACCVGIFVSLPLSIGALMYAYETIFSGPSIQTT